MPGANPKLHDKLFKWLLTEFTADFFAYFFPRVVVRDFRFLDKEFTRELEKHQAAPSADLLLLMEVWIEERVQEILIVIEHKSRREDVRHQIQTYACHALLLRRKPVWCIAFFTDAGKWSAPPNASFPFAFHSEQGLVDFPFDIIKLKEHQSAALIRHRSLLFKLLALEADDTGIEREELIREIYRYVHEHEDELTDRQKMLVEAVVEAYAALPPRTVATIKKEAGVTFVASNIAEHYVHIGEERGEKRGEEKGEKRGREIGLIEGDLRATTRFFEEGRLSEEEFRVLEKKLREELGKAKSARD